MSTGNQLQNNSDWSTFCCCCSSINPLSCLHPLLTQSSHDIVLETGFLLSPFPYSLYSTHAIYHSVFIIISSKTIGFCCCCYLHPLKSPFIWPLWLWVCGIYRIEYCTLFRMLRSELIKYRHFYLLLLLLDEDWISSSSGWRPSPWSGSLFSVYSLTCILFCYLFSPAWIYFCFSSSWPLSVGLSSL